MKKGKKTTIQKRLFLIILSLLAINLIVVLAFGSAFLQRYYMFQKRNELKGYQTQIQSSYQKNDIEALNSQLRNSSINNVTVLIYNRQSGQFYFSGTFPNQPNQPNGRIDPQHWIQLAEAENIFRQLEKENPIILTEKNKISDSIFLYAKMDTDVYLLMETPRAYIEATAQTATYFFSLLLLISLAIGILATHFAAKKIAKPIREIEETAKGIAAMDFQKRCDVHTGDEIEELASSVNQMADKLKENIDLLKKDLQREEKTNKMRNDFVSNVSHDFKTPLSLIEAYSESIKDGTSENIAQACDVIIEQSRRMNHLVNQLLTLSQLEGGVIAFHIEPFCIDELIQNTLQHFHILLNKEKIDLTVQTDSQDIVKGDFRQIEQVVTNLLENAVKYVDEKKKIRLFTEKRGGKLRVSFYNTHPPIQEEQLENLFEMFYKTDSSRTSPKSYGIGLTIVKTIIQAHHEEYGVYNDEEGIVFWFELPLLEEKDEI